MGSSFVIRVRSGGSLRHSHSPLIRSSLTSSGSQFRPISARQLVLKVGKRKVVEIAAQTGAATVTVGLKLFLVVKPSGLGRSFDRVSRLCAPGSANNKIITEIGPMGPRLCLPTVRACLTGSILNRERARRPLRPLTGDERRARRPPSPQRPPRPAKEGTIRAFKF